MYAGRITLTCQVGPAKWSFVPRKCTGDTMNKWAGKHDWMCYRVYMPWQHVSWVGEDRAQPASPTLGQIPCSSNVLLCCFQYFSDSSIRGMSKQYPLTVFLESPTRGGTSEPPTAPHDPTWPLQFEGGGRNHWNCHPMCICNPAEPRTRDPVQDPSRGASYDTTH